LKKAAGAVTEKALQSVPYSLETDAMRIFQYITMIACSSFKVSLYTYFNLVLLVVLILLIKKV
jgi:hypothetical protein